MNHWNAGDDDRCTCLTRDAHEFPHYVHCAVAVGTFVPEQFDNGDIRSLAEVAANSDIDLAVMVYRGYLARGGAR
ncbi:hypothetical protein I5G63_gp089 [Mycobacterium phage Imvubu]|uniref:Uncharacterized protein n=1 Tax=Mycobacterium phage Imvubu TaxID=2686233 RepID=A0A6B9LK36_9CAUD|nr:hypothetical protein I5G63_gp089 [Mycobacterium phage Imvubu]QHB37829.1 hypothetical protein PBI_IMVUBU_89 [Mycobacterium phage Imvubu]